MGRPVKWRRVSQMPTVLQFSPSDRSEQTAPDNILLIEEFEALRLKDLEGMEQEECADQMQVSRPTFQRILLTARQKVADSLVHGKGIRIEGGSYTKNICPVHCLDCGHNWQESIETLAHERDEYICPRCQSNRIVCAPFEPCSRDQGTRNQKCRRNCWRKSLNSRLETKESEREMNVEHHDSD
jgi:uncharacterized protein